MVVPRTTPHAARTHLLFRDFPSLVEPGDVLVINDSRVIPARLLGKRPGGGAAEVLLVTKEGDTWRALVKPGARLREGMAIALGGGDFVRIVEHLPTGERRVRLEGDGRDGGDRGNGCESGDEAIIARRGVLPLPPYITRAPTDDDTVRYQTVYANEPGSVAAPTAGLHFTPEILAALEAKGARIARVTLHVGPGTFRPVATDDPEEHHMDSEAYVIPERVERVVREAREEGRKIWAVGTTSLRALESAANDDGTVKAGAGWTTLFVKPGFRFRVTDRLLTNFHLPRSTLLMLVSAFAGTDNVMAAYREAVERGYRFYSYGDAMVII